MISVAWIIFALLPL